MEFQPLLFTPRTGDRLRGGPGGGGGSEFRTPGGGGLERSPTGGAGTFGGGAGAGAGAPAFGGAPPAAAGRLGSTFREGTPRRRSLTPSGSAMEPSGMLYPGGGSLFESPTAGGPAAHFGHSTQAGWAAAAPPPPPAASLADLGAGGGEQAAFGRSRLGQAGAAPLASPAAFAPAAAAANPADPTGCWVTAFGFAPADRALVLGELARCGDVRRFGTGRPTAHDGGGGGRGPASSSASSSSSAVNWVHVQFSSPHQAARARALDGCLLAGRLLVGVKPLDGAGAADVARLEQGGGGGGGGGDGEAAAGDLDGGELRAAAPVAPVRPYRVDAGDQRALPQHSQSAWAKISELVFGL